MAKYRKNEVITVEEQERRMAEKEEVKRTVKLAVIGGSIGLGFTLLGAVGKIIINKNLGQK